jgi:antitoxin HicB
MEKNLEYYLGLPYTRELIPEPSGIWFVRIKELPNCMSQGNSPEEALRNIDDAMHGWIKGELEDGEIIPEPREEEEYSGKFNMRVTKRLHRLLAEAADQDGMSMNVYISTLLAEVVGRPEKNATQLVQANPSNSYLSALVAICQAAGLENMEGKNPEVEFTIWFRNRLDQFSEQLQTGKRSSALQTLYFVIELLRSHTKNSPILLSLIDLIDKMKQSIERNVDIIPAGHNSLEIGEVINEAYKRNIIKSKVPTSSHKKTNLTESPVVNQFMELAQLGLRKGKK